MEISNFIKKLITLDLNNALFSLGISVDVGKFRNSIKRGWKWALFQFVMMFLLK